MPPAAGPASRKGDTHPAWVAGTVCSKLNLHLLLKCNQKATPEWTAASPATFGRTNLPSSLS